MSDYKTRLLAEETDLCAKLNSLKGFIERPGMQDTVTAPHWSLLLAQYGAMTAYYHILSLRIIDLLDGEERAAAHRAARSAA